MRFPARAAWQIRLGHHRLVRLHPVRPRRKTGRRCGTGRHSVHAYGTGICLSLLFLGVGRFDLNGADHDEFAADLDVLYEPSDIGVWPFDRHSHIDAWEEASEFRFAALFAFFVLFALIKYLER